jgi:hypothetical protein
LTADLLLEIPPLRSTDLMTSLVSLLRNLCDPRVLAQGAFVGMALALSAFAFVGEQDPSDKPDGVFAFTHRVHVPRAWQSIDDDGNWNVQERQRDCRGCHDYAKGQTKDPQAVCTSCHFTNEKNQYRFKLWADPPSFTSDLTALRSPNAFFDHSLHLILECRECHEGSKDDFEPPALIEGASPGEELCMTCHAGDKPRQAELHFMANDRAGNPITDVRKSAALTTLKKGLGEALNDSPSMGPNTSDSTHLGPFRHKEHLLPEFQESPTSLGDLGATSMGLDQARQGNCGACHQPMFEAQAGMAMAVGAPVHAPFEQSAQVCGECHVADEARTPLSFELGPVTRPSAVGGTFSHQDHLQFTRPDGELSKSSLAGYDAIESEGCMACHLPDASREEGYVLKGALADTRSFQGCQSCHEQSAWAPAEHGAWWTPEDHGEWSACSACHQPDSGAFDQARPVAEVRRSKPVSFHLETQQHPHITVAEGESIEGSCRECHRKPVASLPSRIQDVAFDHATHLPASAGPDDCSACHTPDQFQATTSAGLARTSAGVELVYNPAACIDCHRGSAPVPQFAPAQEARSVVEFSHGAHLGQTLVGGGEVGCTTCHVPVAGEAIGTLAAARDCTQCHAHDATPVQGHAALTGGGITAGEVAACSACHLDGFPVAGSPTLIASSRILNLVGSGAQHHPTGEECSNCHLPGAGLLISTVEKPRGNRLFVDRTTYTPPAPNDRLQSGIHRDLLTGTNQATRKHGDDEVNCFYCHWTGNKSGFVGAGQGTKDPEISSVRRALGDNLTLFPGGPALIR